MRTLLVLLLALVSPLAAQQPTDQPQVRINILNVCTPNDADKQELSDALAHLPKGAFTADFEIARGLTSIPDQPVSNWVRIRREFPPASPYTSVQYTFSRDSAEMVETLVFRVRDPKDVLEVSLSDGMPATITPASALASETPANHIKVERFGKPSVALARCANADQTAYQSLFQSASEVLAQYRQRLSVRTIVPADLGRGALPAGGKGTGSQPTKADGSKTAPTPPKQNP